MRYYEIILEAIDYELTAKNWGPKLRARLKGDHSFPQNLLVHDLRSAPVTDLRLIEMIAEFDPTKKKTYLLNWILPRYINGGINLWEDLEGVKEDLDQFDRNKRMMPIKDIIQIKTAADLSDMVRETLGANGGLGSPGGKIIPPDEIKAVYQESIIVYENDTKIVVIPKTERAAGFWGRNTDWCTAWGYRWSRYPSRDSLFGRYGALDGQRLLILADKQSFNTKADCFQCYYADNVNSDSIQIMDQRDLRADGNPTLKNWIETLSDSEINIIVKNCLGSQYYVIEEDRVCIRAEDLRDFAYENFDYDTWRAFSIAIDPGYYIDSLPLDRRTLKGIIENDMPLWAVQKLEKYVDLKYPGNSSISISTILEKNALAEKDLMAAIRNTDEDCHILGYKKNIISAFNEAMSRIGLDNYLKYVHTPFTFKGPTVRQYLANPSVGFKNIVTVNFDDIKKEYDEAPWAEEENTFGESAFITVLDEKMQELTRRS